MRVIKVDATNSTNSFLRERFGEFQSKSVCAIAQNQLEGRGQMGTSWQSEIGENLTFSVLFKNLQIPAQTQFKLSAIVSLSLLEVLNGLKIEELKVKWPNDILAENQKIAGILIENILKGDKIHATIIGIGLNVNQEIFLGLPKAASLKMLTGKAYDLESLLEKLLFVLERNMENMQKVSTAEIMREYHRNLFGIHEEHCFQLPNGEFFQGKIQGVDPHGKLIVEDESKDWKFFQLKEVKMLY